MAIWSKSNDGAPSRHRPRSVTGYRRQLYAPIVQLVGDVWFRPKTVKSSNLSRRTIYLRVAQFA